jgi:CubicO group peptidase (beta-lactamase class C family)
MVVVVALTDRLGLIRRVVQPVLDQQAQLFNASVTFGFADGNGTLGLAAGIDDIFKGTPMTPDTMIPAGSVTKTWTAVAIMQAVEKGLLSLDDKVI